MIPLLKFKTRINVKNKSYFSITYSQTCTKITREKAEREAAEKSKQQVEEESDDGVVVGKVLIRKKSFCDSSLNTHSIEPSF